MIITLLFFASGMTGLIYQGLWVRLLSLGVGSTTEALGLVLAVFFLGLSLGSALAGQWERKIAKPILTYGVAEVFIGLFSLVLFEGLLEFTSINLFLSELFGQTLATAFLVLLFILPPTIAMGTTLPLLIKAFSHWKKGKRVSYLYGVNTFGAAFGALASGFLLIPAFGVEGGHNIAVAANLALGFAAIIYSVLKEKSFLPPSKDSAKPQMKRLLNSFTLLAFLSGFSSLLIEVVWNKYLGIFLGTNILGLSLLLFIYLLGMALGSIILSFVADKIEQKERGLFILGSLVFLSLLAAGHLLNYLPHLTYTLALPGFPALMTKGLAVLITLFVPTLLMGSFFPFLLYLIDLKGNKEGISSSYSIGWSYSANTIGAISGSLLASLVLIPTLGSGLSFKIGLFFSLLSLFIILPLIPARKKLFLQAAVGLCLVLIFSPSLHYKNLIRSAYFNYHEGFSTRDELSQALSQSSEKFEFLAEGKSAIISLSHDKAEGEDYKNILRLKTNGLNESVYHLEDLETVPKYEGLLGILPYLYQEKSQSAFIVGYGGGFTVRTLGKLPLKEIQVAELEQGIIDASNYTFQQLGLHQDPVLNQDNVNLVIDDARSVLIANPQKKYDILVSQPSQSWLAGVANLFTLEFFELVKSRLTDQGIFSQWMNLYNSDKKVMASILKTFFSVFPHGAIYTNQGDEEIILLGSRKKLSWNQEKFRTLITAENWQHNLSLLQFYSKGAFLSNFLATKEDLWDKVKEAPLNTDRNAYAEVRQTLLFYQDPESTPVEEFLFGLFTPGTLERTHPLSQTDKADYLWGLFHNQQFEKLYTSFQKFLATSKDTYTKFELAFSLELYHSAYELTKKLPQPQRSEKQMEVLFQLGRYKEVTKRKSVSGLTRCLQFLADPQRPPKNLECYNYTSLSNALRGWDRENAMQDFPYHEKLLPLMIREFTLAQDWQGLKSFTQDILDHKTSEKERVTNLARYFDKLNLTKDAEWLRSRYTDTLAKKF